MDTETLTQTVEAILFYKGEPMKLSHVATLLKIPEESLAPVLERLQQTLKGRGIQLVQEGAYVGLATAPETQHFIEAMKKEELEGPLGKAGLETLAIIIYQGLSSKADIEYIRGVNCSSILRSLVMRGLIERVPHPHDKRSYLYQPTLDLPAALGVSSLTDIPQYESFKEKISEVLAEKEGGEETEST